MTPRTATKRVTLGDLSDDDRAALLEEAREAARHNPTNVPGYEELSDQERLIRGLMDARDHLRGCPVQEGRTLGRVEGYDGRKPPNPATGTPERRLAVIRCIECGGTSVLAVPLEEALERAALENLTPATAAGGDGDTP
jgi:hypothetical protein